MPTISTRGESIPPSPIRKLVPYADTAKERGVEVIHLNIGQPDIATPKVMMDVAKNLDIEVLAYSPSPGYTSYRLKLSDYYMDRGLDLEMEEIIVTTGGSEAIRFAMMACMDPGDEVIIPEPYYANYNGFSIESGIEIKTVASIIQDGFALPRIESITEKITEKTKAILICNPNNPTGYLYSKEELEILRDICLEHDLFLLSDEAYREFCYDGRTHFSVLRLEGLDEHAILLDTISKRYSACGARIGCIASRNKDVMKAALKLAQARLSPPSLEQHMAEAALDLPQSYYEDMRSQFEKRRDLLVAELNAVPGVLCPNPGGAFYVIAELPIDHSDNFCQWMLEEFDHNGKTVMMAPATGFYNQSELGSKQVRMAYVLEEKKIKEAVECLKAGLEAYPNCANTPINETILS